MTGAGVGVLSTTTPGSFATSCSSAQSCFGIAFAWGAQRPLLTPNDTKLSFQSGLFEMVPPAEWSVGITYSERATPPWSLFWLLTGVRTAVRTCRNTRTFQVRVVVEAAGLKVCFSPLTEAASFASRHVLYITTVNGAPVDSTLSQRDHWLLRRCGECEPGELHIATGRG